MRSDIYFYVKKDSTYKIFNSILGDRESAILNFYKPGIVKFLDPSTTLDNLCYILSPYLPHPKSTSDSLLYDLKVGFMLSREILHSLYAIFNMISGRVTSFEYDEISYSEKKYKNYSLIRSKSDEIGEIVFKKYKTLPRMIIKLKDVVERMKKYQKSSVTKQMWCSIAIDMLLKLLRDENVIGDGDVSEYPDIIPLLFPFKMLVFETSHWSSINLITLSIDFGKIDKSPLRFLFNMKVVNDILKYGDLYVISEEY